MWHKILEPFEKMRVENDLVKCFPSYLSGEDLFGLTEPTVIRIVESVSRVRVGEMWAQRVHVNTVPPSC